LQVRNGVAADLVVDLDRAEGGDRLRDPRDARDGRAILSAASSNALMAWRRTITPTVIDFYVSAEKAARALRPRAEEAARPLRLTGE
jgi:hypothetical protein